MIFSMKALIYTAITAGVGLLFYFLFNSLGFFWVGVGFLGAFAGTGFIIGTFKVPDVEGFEFTRKTGGEDIDDVIKRAIKFKSRKNRIYVYTKEENE